MRHYRPIRRAAVLGAGVMGAQIAAHLVNAGIDTRLFELAADEGDPNSLVTDAIGKLRKLMPTPLGNPAAADLIQPCNYREHLDRLSDCDLVIEAVAERMDIKKDLYGHIAEHVRDNVWLASNTSGLSITELAGTLPESLRANFCGVHFFNPPRYMHLVELIPHQGTAPELLNDLEAFLTREIGKGVVRAKDTPNFIGNRIGGFSILSCMYHTEQLGLGFDVVDQLTGPAIGRPKSATFRTADVVGLDTLGHVITTMRDQLTDDPWHGYFEKPDTLAKLIDQGALGQKAGAGFYRKQGKVIQVLDREQGDYVESQPEVAKSVQKLLKQPDPARRMAALRENDTPEANFLWAIFRDLCHYSAYHLADIADSAREVDQAIRWGYGWQQGPFELWQAGDWRAVAEWIREDIEAGEAMTDAPLPDWVSDGRKGVHGAGGSWSPRRGEDMPRPDLPVYRRQLRPEKLLGEPVETGNTVAEDEHWCAWTPDDQVLVLGFKTKMHSVSNGVIDGIQQSIDRAERDFAALILWQDSEPFCVGADLKGMAGMAENGDRDGIERMIADFQTATMRLKYAAVPTVAGVRGMALGGGCELVLQSQRAVAALESYIGLVEAGVGLLPGAGGMKEMALRSVINTPDGADRYPLLKQYFEQIAMGKVAGSAQEARAFGYLRPADIIVMHPHEVLYVARQQALAMAESGHRPPLRSRTWPAAGDVGVATLKMMLVNMHEGAFISDHDFEIAERMAKVICGGEIDRDTPVDEQWYLDLERSHFMELVFNAKSQERIAHMLKTGKPLRN